MEIASRKTSEGSLNPRWPLQKELRTWRILSTSRALCWICLRTTRRKSSDIPKTPNSMNSLRENTSSPKKREIHGCYNERTSKRHSWILWRNNWSRTSWKNKKQGSSRSITIVNTRPSCPSASLCLVSTTQRTSDINTTYNRFSTKIIATIE